MSQLPVAAPPPRVDTLDDDAAPTMARARLLALPGVLALSIVISLTGFGRMVTGVFFAMWLHELGHAVTSWFTGVMAVPLPWMTMSSGERSVLFVLLEFGALGFWAFRRRQAADGDWRAAWLPCALGVLLVIGLVVPLNTMQMIGVFAGDAGALVFGTLLMLTVFLPDDARLSRGGLRWGFLVIGAAAYANVATAWFSAWRDPAEIPFGRIEGVGLSDPTRLVETWGWSEHRVVVSYLVVSALCVVVLLSVALYSHLRRE
jgi:hypothetical protein